MERRYLPAPLCAVRCEQREGQPPTVTGYAAVFYSAGDPGTEFALYPDLVERIAPGAFDRAMREDDVRALYNHNPDHLLGRTSAGTLALSVDARGLRYDIRCPDTQTARDVMANIQAGNLSGSSFSFTPRRVEFQRPEGDAPAVRWLRDVQLYDIGPVTFPAYEGTTAGARSLVPAEVRSAYEAWRRESDRQGYLKTARAKEVGL